MGNDLFFGVEYTPRKRRRMMNLPVSFVELWTFRLIGNNMYFFFILLLSEDWLSNRSPDFMVRIRNKGNSSHLSFQDSLTAFITSPQLLDIDLSELYVIPPKISPHH